MAIEDFKATQRERQTPYGVSRSNTTKNNTQPRMEKTIIAGARW